MNERQVKLEKVIEAGAKMLQPMMPWADAAKLLKAIAMVESSFGLIAVPKHEKAYDWGGTYFRKDLWFKHGSLVAMSYSSFQIMYGVAVELGFDENRHPCELNDDEVAIYFVVDLIRKRILARGAQTLQQVADAYNSGSFKDGIIPSIYIAKFMDAYEGTVQA
jgi:hypothetical protein